MDILRAIKFVTKPLNDSCTTIVNEFIDHAEFIIEGSNPFSLFVIREYDYDQREVDNVNFLFMSCFNAHRAQKDLD